MRTADKHAAIAMRGRIRPRAIEDDRRGRRGLRSAARDRRCPSAAGLRARAAHLPGVSARAAQNLQDAESSRPRSPRLATTRSSRPAAARRPAGARGSAARARCAESVESRLVSFELADLQAILLGQAVQPTGPPLASSDDCGLNQQALPLPGCPESPGHNRCAGICVGFSLSGFGIRHSGFVLNKLVRRLRCFFRKQTKNLVV